MNKKTKAALYVIACVVLLSGLISLFLWNFVSNFNNDQTFSQMLSNPWSQAMFFVAITTVAAALALFFIVTHIKPEGES